MEAKHEQTRAALLSHAAVYPEAQLQDFFKFLYQSAFGCEHLVADPSAAAEYIRRESEATVPHNGDPVEPLDGSYCRVHLDVLKEGLRPETLASLFACSAEPQQDGIQRLTDGLEILRTLVRTGKMPFAVETTEQEISTWQAAGFPACHHSARFRDAYRPAYRVLRKDLAVYLPLFAAIDRELAQRERLTIAIDGSCASGKTTLASLLRTVYGCPVFHMDDYFLRPEQRTPSRYREPGGNVDRERFSEEVLGPLCAGKTVHFRRFDCATMTLQASETVEPTRLTVVEGSYSLHPALRDAYNLRVFLTIDAECRMQRILHRNGPEAAKMFAERWIPLEQAYFDAFHPE